MNRDKTNDNTRAQLASLFRGLYKRVADKLGVDPSYVSRVARGQRRSDAVLSALTEEVKEVLAQLESRERQSRGTARITQCAQAVAAVEQEAKSMLATASRTRKHPHKR